MNRAGETPAPQASAKESLAAWRAALNQALHGDSRFPASVFPLPPLLPALADTVHRFHIPHDSLTAVIDGVEMDLTPRRYETFDELERYCERVASAVGMACIHIWGFHGVEAIEPARQVGVALQLTNILRDIKEDAAAGRVYLPLADLRQHGYSLDDLQAGVANDAFAALMQFEIERAKRFYHNGVALWDSLEPDGRKIFGLMTTTYWRLLRQIEQCPADVLRRRVRLSPLTKAKLFAGWMFRKKDSSDILSDK
jgi:phytoene synthase